MNDSPDIDLPTAKPIPVSLFCRRSNKTTQLVNNTNKEFSVEGKHRWLDFEFEQPVFIQSITVETEGYSDWNVVRFEFNGVSGEKYKNEAKNNQGSFSAVVGRVAQGFRFKPDEKFSLLSSQKIKRVVVLGYTLDELTAFEDAIGLMDRREKEIDQKYENIAEKELQSQNSLETLKTETDQLQKSKIQLDTDIGQSQAQLEGLKKENAASAMQQTELEGKIQDIDSSVSIKKAEHRELNNKIASKKTELERITQEIRLFPSEISEFVKQGGRTIKYYMLMSLPFVFVIMCVTYYLFFNSIELTQIYKTNEVDIWEIFLTRLPFVTVLITILHVCGFIVYRFVNEIIQINKQQLNLSKLSIVAKDVSTASSVDLDLTSDQKFELETHLKMELLREHIKQYVGEEFTYQGGRVEKLLPKWMKKKKTEKQTVAELDIEDPEQD